jgi:diguanylate cyclase (GGDEF)-like protein
VPVGDDVEASTARRRFREEVALHETPLAMLWLASAFIVISLVQFIVSNDDDWLPHVVHLGLAVVLLVIALLGRMGRIPGSALPWVAAGAAVFIVLASQWEVARHPSAIGLAYVLIAMTAFGPFVLSVAPMLLASLAMFAGLTVVANDVSGQDEGTWLVAGIGALVIGFISLRMRLDSIDATADAVVFSRRSATRDPLTGVLNRRGVEERMPELMALAERQESSLFVAFVDIDALKVANDRYGHEFGDSLIIAVARSVEASVRASDAVGRWGGDEFIVVGLGAGQDADQMSARVSSTLQRQMPHAEWQSSVSIGTAAGLPRDGVFDQLVREADKRMYARRQAARTNHAANM